MYIHLYRNQPKGNAITGRLVIDGKWFCDTLERKGYQILPLCYHVAVTQSPKFKRLLPIVQNVPQRSGIRIHRGTKPEHSTGCILVVADNKQKGIINNNLNVREAIVRPKGDKNINLNNNNTNYINLNNNNSNNLNQQQLRSTPNCHEQFRGPRSSQQHSERSREDVPQPRGCVVSPAEELLNNVVNVVVTPSPVGCRSAAEIERELTSLILKAQQDHEEIILEITDYRVGTDYGYNHQCEPELQQHAIDARRAAQRYNELCPTERHA